MKEIQLTLDQVDRLFHHLIVRDVDGNDCDLIRDDEETTLFPECLDVKGRTWTLDTEHGKLVVDDNSGDEPIELNILPTAHWIYGYTLDQLKPDEGTVVLVGDTLHKSPASYANGIWWNQDNEFAEQIQGVKRWWPVYDIEAIARGKADLPERLKALPVPAPLTEEQDDELSEFENELIWYKGKLYQPLGEGWAMVCDDSDLDVAASSYEKYALEGDLHEHGKKVYLGYEKLKEVCEEGEVHEF